MNESQVNLTLEHKIDGILKHLEQISLKLESYKPLLDHHASCTEFEIKANFDSLVDALNQRQLSLLKQLTKVYKEKLTLIDNQRQMIDTIRTGINSCISSRHTSDSHIHELISRAESAVINSSSDPFISFLNERSILPQSIATYGKVVSRYGGHFADPGRPSACLPLAVEDEDDHEDAHDHSTVRARVSSTCSCVKPDLQKWLFPKSHRCSSGNRTIGSCTTWNPLQRVPGLQQAQSSGAFSSEMFSRPSNRTDKKPTEFSQFDSVCASDYNDWLTSPMPQQSNAHKKAIDCCIRKSSNTLSTAYSECTTIGSYSDSFSILTGSATGRSASLTDWLLCEPQIQLSDIPGLATNVMRRSSTFADPSKPVATDWTTKCLSHWLVPCADLDVTRESSDIANSFGDRPPLLPPHLTQGGTLDLVKWLSREQPSPGTKQNPEIDLSPCEEINSTTIEEPVNSEIVVVQEPEVLDYCIYSQCHGGPGGPTCCGARVKCNKTVAQDLDYTAELPPGAIPQQKLNATPYSDASATKEPTCYTHPVVAQMNEIISTHWTQWLNTESSSPERQVKDNAQIQKPNSRPTVDTLKWLHPSAPNPIYGQTTNSLSRDPVSCEDSVSPPKRRSLTGFALDCGDRTIVQSPFINTPDHADLCKPTCFLNPESCESRKPTHAAEFSTKSLVPLTTTCVDELEDYEAQLLQKIHKLTTGPCSMLT